MRSLALALFGLLLVAGLASVVALDSPYSPDVATEAAPFAPERPDPLTGERAATYAVEYEERRFHNDLVAARNYEFDRGDEIETACEALSTSSDSEGRFRVRLRCRGGIDDAYRAVPPEAHAYTVTYVVGETQTTLVDAEGYPFGTEETPRPPPWSAS